MSREQIKVQNVNKVFEIIINVEGNVDKKCAGMSVLRSIVQLDTGTEWDIVIGDIAIDFWKACIETVNSTEPSFTVFALQELLELERHLLCLSSFACFCILVVIESVVLLGVNS